MKILQVHNRYAVGLGGEDTVLEAEAALLRAHGHEVLQHFAHNEAQQTEGLGASLRSGLRTVWSQRAYQHLRELLRAEAPDIMHVHNTFAQLSPSIYWAAAHERVPVVQTLHNYRLSCANGLLLRDGAPCEACVGKPPLAALQHRCYRGSFAATAAVSAMHVTHRRLGTYRHKVGAYIALTAFAKGLMVRAGLPEERIFVKPNFLPEPALSPLPPESRREQVLFVGRLAAEKGLDTLLAAWAGLEPQGAQLVIIGDGPERATLQARYPASERLVWRGWLGQGEVLQALAESRFLVVPSRWYEVFPMVVLEAYAVGTPVLVPAHAGFPEVVTAGETGFLYRANDEAALRQALREALALGADWAAYSQGAYRRYRACYSPVINYASLRRIYQELLTSTAEQQGARLKMIR